MQFKELHQIQQKSVAAPRKTAIVANNEHLWKNSG